MGTCFVMMPFGGSFDERYSRVIRESVISAGLRPVRADEIYSARSIIKDIYDAIQRAEICIADVTGRNPNVSYELGVAHATQKPVILITQNIEDIPFDYHHLRVISYSPSTVGWETIFSRTLRETLTEVSKDPFAHTVLRRVPDDTSKSMTHLTNIFLSTSYDLDRSNQLFADSTGNTLIKSNWKVKAHSPVYHLCHNIVCDKAGDIEVRRVRDKMSARDLKQVTINKSPSHLSYFFLFEQFKKAGQHFEVETEVYAENYFDFKRFFEVGETMMSTQAVTGGIRYTARSDWIYFPRVKPFSRIIGEYRSHPNPDKIGELVQVTEEGEHFVLKMFYNTRDPFQQETAAVLRLAHP